MSAPDTSAILARSATGLVHLVEDRPNRTFCGQRLASLDVQRGPASAVTCKSCRQRLAGSR